VEYFTTRRLSTKSPRLIVLELNASPCKQKTDCTWPCVYRNKVKNKMSLHCLVPTCFCDFGRFRSANRPNKQLFIKWTVIDLWRHSYKNEDDKNMSNICDFYVYYYYYYYYYYYFYYFIYLLFYLFQSALKPLWVLAYSTVVEYSQQEGFYKVPLPAARQTPILEDQWLERSNSRHRPAPLACPTCLLLPLAVAASKLFIYQMLYVQFLSSWWWAEKPPETYRALTVIKNIA
jgi:hypothetical protein